MSSSSQNLEVDIPGSIRITSKSSKGPAGPQRSSSRHAARPLLHRSLLGNSWVHDNIILPLLSHTPTLELFECYPSEGTNTTETLMAWQLATTHRKLLAQGMASEDALRRAFKRIYGVVLREITPAINSAFEDLTLLSAMPR